MKHKLPLATVKAHLNSIAPRLSFTTIRRLTRSECVELYFALCTPAMRLRCHFTDMGAISTAFDWDKTPQGFDFWQRVSLRLHFNETK